MATLRGMSAHEQPVSMLKTTSSILISVLDCEHLMILSSGKASFSMEPFNRLLVGHLLFLFVYDSMTVTLFAEAGDCQEGDLSVFGAGDCFLCSLPLGWGELFLDDAGELALDPCLDDW